MEQARTLDQDDWDTHARRIPRRRVAWTILITVAVVPLLWGVWPGCS